MKPLLFNLLFEINSDSSGLPLGNRLKLILGLKPRTTSDRSAIRLVNYRNVNTVPEETFAISPSNTSVVNTSTTVEQTVEIGIKSL